MIPYIKNCKIEDLIQILEDQKPIGRFYALCPCCGAYIGVDNSTGQPRRVESYSLEQCLQALLHGNGGTT